MPTELERENLHNLDVGDLDVAQRVADRVRIECETRVAVEVDAYFASRFCAVKMDERVEFDWAVDP